MRPGSLGRITLATFLLGGLGVGACVTSPPAPAPPPATAAPSPVPMPSRKASPSPPAPAPPRVLAPQLSADEKELLRQEASARIESAERLVKQLGERKLGPDERDTFATVQNLLVRARAAFAEANLKEASNLADKAEVLAAELARSGR